MHTFRLRKSFVIFLAVIICLIVGLVILNSKKHLLPQKVYSAADFGITVLKSPVDKDGDGVDDFTDIMLGAREYIDTNPTYSSRYYDGGYPNDDYGVCTDVAWYAFKSAGYSLKGLLDADIATNLQQYPTIETPEPNIDFRRVKNLRIFFQRNAEVLTNDLQNHSEWQPGDIVIYSDHIAICSDKRNASGEPYIIHFDGFGPRESNDVRYGDITGHFRWRTK